MTILRRDNFSSYVNTAALVTALNRISDPTYFDMFGPTDPSRVTIDPLVTYNGNQTCKVIGSFAPSIEPGSVLNNVWIRTVYRVSPTFFSVKGAIDNASLSIDNGYTVDDGFDDYAGIKTRNSHPVDGTVEDKLYTLRELGIGTGGGSPVEDIDNIGELCTIASLQSGFVDEVRLIERLDNSPARFRFRMWQNGVLKVNSTHTISDATSGVADFGLVYQVITADDNNFDSNNYIHLGLVEWYNADVDTDPYDLLPSFSKPALIDTATVKSQVAAPFQAFWDSLILLVTFKEGSGSPASTIGPVLTTHGSPVWATQSGVLGLVFDAVDDYISLTPVIGDRRAFTMLAVTFVEGFGGGGVYGETAAAPNDSDRAMVVGSVDTRMVYDNADENFDNYETDASGHAVDNVDAWHAACCSIDLDGVSLVSRDGGTLLNERSKDQFGITPNPVFVMALAALGANIADDVVNNLFEGKLSLFAIFDEALTQNQMNLLTDDAFGLVRVPAEVSDDNGSGSRIPIRLLKSRRHVK